MNLLIGGTLAKITQIMAARTGAARTYQKSNYDVRVHNRGTGSTLG